MARTCVLVASLLVFAASASAGCGGGGGDGSSLLTLGEEAVVSHADSSVAGATPTTLGVTVLALRQGTQQELEDGGFSLDPDEKELVPYYLDARFANKGDTPIERSMRPSLEDGDGNLLSPTTIISLGGPPFEQCARVSDGQLEPGDSYESCTLFLVDPDTTPSRASFLPYVPGESTDFVQWDVSS